MKNVYSNTQRGFTLIELMLVLAFLGSLMLLISASVVQAVSIYNKGNAVKQINQAGRALVEDINRLSSAGAEVEIDDNGTAGCLRVGFTGGDGTVFLWNSLEKGFGGSAANSTLDTKWEINGEPLRLVRSNKGADTEKYCNPLPTTTGPRLSTADAADMTPLVDGLINVLSVDIASSSNPSLKKITFWLGTGSTAGPQLTEFDPVARTWRCPGGSLGEFCAVSKYETVIYTPNSGGTP